MAAQPTSNLNNLNQVRPSPADDVAGSNQDITSGGMSEDTSGPQQPNQQPNQDSSNPESQFESKLPWDSEKLLKALLSRGKDPKYFDLKLSQEEEQALVNHVIQDFQDADPTAREFKDHMTDMLANWRGTVTAKSFPFDDCANLRQPFTSVIVETMKTRLTKAIFGGDSVGKVNRIDKQIASDELKELNQWFEWELDEVVKFKRWFKDAIHNTLVYGLDISFPQYKNDTRFLHSVKTWSVDENLPLDQLVSHGIQEILDSPNDWGTEDKTEVIGFGKPGEVKLNDDGKIVFSFNLENSQLQADIWKREVIFNGVEINQVQLEDLVINNTSADINKLPFLGIRLWYSVQEYLDAIADNWFIDYGDEENLRIIKTFDLKYGKEISQQQTDLQDRESGTDSRALNSSYSNTRKFGEFYRWEGWWVWDKSNPSDNDNLTIDRIVQPATQICVWVSYDARRVVKISRLEDINKDAKRSGIKLGFIEEPGRFYSMGLAEWVRHSQAELDAVHNQRLDSGFLYNVPFGFYKPTAGIGKAAQPIQIQPGKFFPVNDPMGINMPRTNWQPAVSFNEEALIFKYGNLQAGLNDSSLGTQISKRQSASEYVGTANAIDTRTEDIVDNLVRGIRTMLERVLGLYQQFAPRNRIFRVGGEGGVKLIKQFERDRLQGRFELDMAATLQQLNEDLKKQVALDMLQLLLNQVLIEMQIVGPDTIYEAIKLLAEVSHYKDVPIHKPKTEPISDQPDIEEQQIFAGQSPIGPTMGENTQEHMAHHSMTAADQKLMMSWSEMSRQNLAAHIQKTLQMEQAQKILAQQRAMLATQMAQTMQNKGIRPGMAGQQNPGASSQLGPGNQSEGVSGAGSPQGTGPSANVTS